MRRVGATLVALALAVGAAGCGEHYTTLQDGRVIVTDGDGSVDAHNIETACTTINRVVDSFQTFEVESDHTGAIVTCVAPSR